jgi:hypothetical protein
MITADVLSAPAKATAAPAPQVAVASTLVAPAPLLAYASGLAALNAQGWPKLPLGPYPPAGDTTNFPRTGDPSLIINPEGLTLAQRAEPGKVTLGIEQQAEARQPQLNEFFWIGAVCLVGYFVLRSQP